MGALITALETMLDEHVGQRYLHEKVRMGVLWLISSDDIKLQAHIKRIAEGADLNSVNKRFTQLDKIKRGQNYMMLHPVILWQRTQGAAASRPS
eukprot:1151866-Pelagomonas_calceolata.AAC.7